MPVEFCTIVEILVRILAALAVGGLLTIIPKIKEWFTAKAGVEQAAYLEKLVGEFVKAAEQLLKEEDKDGSKRKAYVEEQLSNLEIEVTAQIEAYIESAVFSLNKANTTKK